jgi:group I intron endonuclease
MSCGIYKIENTVTGKFYFGSSKNIEARWHDHKKRLRKNKHENAYLQASWNKYGEASFSFSVLELCPVNALLTVEQKYIDTYWDLKQNCYNIAIKAGSGPGPKKGSTHSQQTKDKQSESLKGNKNALGSIRTESFRKALSESNMGEANNQAKLTRLQVDTIRSAAVSGIKAVDLAIQYNVHYWTIVRILKYETWK